MNNDKQMEELANQVAESIYRDAERYRWLKARNPEALASIAWGASSNACQFSASELDTAIDQAMKAWPAIRKKEE